MLTVILILVRIGPPRKVRFKDGFDNLPDVMAVHHNLPPNPSWKDMLLGGASSVSVVNHNDSSIESDRGRDGDFDLLDEDVQTTIINGISAINFFDRIKEMLFKEMELTVVIKLLGRNIGYNTLHNRTMNYFWAIPHRSALDQRIQPSTTLSQCSVSMDSTENRTRGRFARLAVFLNLDKPLVSKVLVDLVDGQVQRVEYEALPTVCFGCGKYGYVKDLCPMVVEDRAPERPMEEMNIESAPVAVKMLKKRGQILAPGCWSRDDLGVAKGVCEETLGIDKNVRGNDNNNRIVKQLSNVMSPLTDMGLKPIWKKSSAIGAAGVGKDLVDLGQEVGRPSMVSNTVTPTVTKEGVPSGQQIQAWKTMEKQPLIGSGVNPSCSEKFNTGIFITNSSSKFNVAGSSNFHSSSNEANLEVESLNDSSTEIREDLNNENFTNITAHFNPAFEESGGGRLGEGIPVSKEKYGGRDSYGCSSRKSSNALRGRGSHFKSSGNSKVPLAESMEEMAKLISNSKLSSKLNAETQRDCASDKFPRIFREYNREFSPDIISLLETRVSGAKVDNVIARLGFPNSHRVGAIGFSGGIWVCWKNTVSVEIISNHPQFILARVGSVSSSMSVFISFIYGSPNKQKRKDLWKKLNLSIPLGSYPWVAIGDFNAILSSFENSGGRSNGRRCPNFGDFVEQAELHDLSYKGPLFTWHRGSLFERLDRAVGNKAWAQYFPKCFVSHLPKIKSEHRPILLTLNPDSTLPKGRPFRFLAGWVEHPNFSNFVKDKWSFSGTMTDTLTTFTHDPKE
ncbi:hypothetical protein CXB51_028415 [Gossypium anomalum]|uniref:Endonuclease/exonuclease/phosphatase domain-containing protein n=1 Tax=Gossypium anomalum TaxID=47600 RepID=A0A8J6CSR4_9ROSI|nr:hypothetical protein CXB51_028415 [Gossypium anomalum]